MKKLSISALLLTIFAVCLFSAQTPSGSSVERLDPALDAIVSPNARIEILKSDYFGNVEGPLWVKEGQSGYILISDIGLPEVDVGLLGGCRHAMRLFGHSRTRRMMLTGYRVPGAELHRLGVVEACTTPEERMPTALEMAQVIASKSPVSTRMGKHTLNVIEDMSLRDGYRYEQDMTAAIAKTEDAKEAQLAFKEKRAPAFKGR